MCIFLIAVLYNMETLQKEVYITLQRVVGSGMIYDFVQMNEEEPVLENLKQVQIIPFEGECKLPFQQRIS